MTIDQAREVQALLVGHCHADHAFGALRGSVKAQDQPAVEKLFRALEREMLQHMADEERLLLADYELVDRDDALAILADHVKIRVLLADACALAALQEIDDWRLRSIVNVLLAHHGHEETGMYRWARARPAAG